MSSNSDFVSSFSVQFLFNVFIYISKEPSACTACAYNFIISLKSTFFLSLSAPLWKLYCYSVTKKKKSFSLKKLRNKKKIKTILILYFTLEWAWKLLIYFIQWEISLNKLIFLRIMNYRWGEKKNIYFNKNSFVTLIW